MEESIHQKVLFDLIEEYGYPRGTYTIEDSVGEGKFMPLGTKDDPVEECSGVVVGDDGHRYFYWMEWDEDNSRPTMCYWDDVTGMDLNDLIKV